MDFSEILGPPNIIRHLKQTVQTGRIPHTQLFVGKTGSGILPVAIAYANEVLKYNAAQDDAKRALCQAKVKKLAHPDLHFVYPVNTNVSVKKNPVSSNFIETWRDFVFTNPYATYYEWLQALGINNKQGNISKFEAEEISKILALKPFEGGYRVLIIWMADKMNNECANKILKLVEEPPEKTVLLLLTEKEEQILPTILSRCQRLHFPKLSETAIANYLSEKENIDQNKAHLIARKSNGDYNQALHFLHQNEEDLQFEKWFINWLRTAFKAKGNKAVVQELLAWSENLAKEGRETQKKFLQFCLELFRQALLQNYGAEPLVFFESNDPKFSIKKFAPFIHNTNIFEITQAIENAIYHIERNGNAKIIFTDLSMQLTRLIHKTEAV